ncbi:MAG: polysaccharide biosynthesis/export protein, partial [Abditibacteriota bacterium]|nr:polysaccharide biosynthesis/export protein [Abditibacteriota bacterium]
SAAEPLELARNATVIDAIARAGGLAVKTEDARITIMRRTNGGEQEFLTINAVALYDQRDPSQNARLAEGDLINVSEARKQNIIVSGQVTRPGPYEIEEAQTIGDAIAKAGGEKPNASLSAVILKRGTQTFTVDAFDAVRFGKPLPGELATLRDGDSIIVPENKNRVMVAEAVLRPGIVPIPEREKFTLLDAISAAGGYKPNAKTSDVALFREVAPGKVERTVISFKDLRRGSNLAIVTQPLQPNDIIVVPEGSIKQSPLGTISSALNLLSVLRIF